MAPSTFLLLHRLKPLDKSLLFSVVYSSVDVIFVWRLLQNNVMPVLFDRILSLFFGHPVPRFENDESVNRDVRLKRDCRERIGVNFDVGDCMF